MESGRLRRVISGAILACSALLLVGSSGCNKATVGLHENTSIPSDAAGTCANHCESIGLQLTSVVIMADNVGCVCGAAADQPPGPPGTSPAPSGLGPPAGPSGAAAGMAALIMEEERRRAADQASASNASTTPPPSTPH